MKPSDYYHLGKASGLTWYADSAPAIQACGAARLAATSARCGILDNVRRALRGTSPLPAHAGNLARAASGQPLSGPKVEAFRRALSGDLDAVPVDVWMLRAYGIDRKPTLGDIRAVTLHITRVAKRRGIAPRDYAAAIWCGILLHHGREPLNYGTALARLQAQGELWPK